MSKIITPEDHAAEIERLNRMNRKTILATKLKDILLAVQEGKLTVKEITQYTSITEEQLADLLKSFSAMKVE